MTSNPLEPVVQINFACKTCSKAFSTNRNLHRHVKRNHASTKLQCFYCKFVTKFKECLVRHVLRHLEKKDFGRSQGVYVKCPLCEFGCVEREKMIEHYVGEHDVVMKEQNYEFPSQTEFLDWKRGIEEKDVCQYTSRSKKNRGAVNIRYYRCFRDGIFQKKGKGIRNMKLKGSIKINGICPAQMKVEEDKSSGVVRVTFIRTHIGHSHELGLLNLNKSERAEIARKLSEGMSHEDILGGIRGSMDSNIKRLHLITHKDIWNVQSSFGLDKLKGKRSKSAKPTTVQDARTDPIQPPEKPSEPVDKYETYVANFEHNVVYRHEGPPANRIPEPNDAWNIQGPDAHEPQHYFSAQRVPENAISHHENYMVSNENNHLTSNDVSIAACESSCDNDDRFIEDMIVPELPHALPQSGSQLSDKKTEIRTKLEEILNVVKCNEHADLVYHELLRIEATIHSIAVGEFGLSSG